MGRRGPVRLGLALALVLVVQQTFADHQCKTGCRGTSQVFKYSPGTTYKYNYEGKIDITLSSAEGQVSSTDVKAVVLLTQQDGCNQLLRLQNVQITSGTGKKHAHIPDVEKAIQLNFHDGHIEDSICTDPSDTQHSLNIKRAIASIFQVNLKNSHETDIFGVCPTEIAQHQENGELVVIKSRDLNKCAYREHLRQDFFATTFNLNSEIKTSPVLNGDYTSKLRIKNGILNQAQISENYLYVPFSVGKSGAKAEITSKLHYISSSKETPQSAVSVPKSIIFDNPHPVVAPSSNVNTVLNAVKEVVKSIDLIVGDKTAKHFIDLIKTIRVAKKDDLLAVYNQVRSGVGFSDKVVAKKVFLDALLQAGVGDAIEVAVTLLKSHELSEHEQKLVYIGLSFVRHATENSIKTATQLLALPNLPQEAYLGIGNLVGRYCSQHSCENVDVVNQITQKLLPKLANPKTTDKNVENEIILVLKTLGNFGHLNENVAQKIIAIAQNKQAASRLRAVALETYLSDPCKDKVRNSALSILQDIQNDSEIRIKAYLVLVQCPNAKIGNAVKALLNKEPSYQVGGFISSHIRNIKASANPDKNLAKQFLNFNVPKKFPVDFRRWSYNGEFSYAIDTLGLGAAAEANVIYSQESYLARALGINVTGEVFGHSFNFLELNLRQENLDKLIEHYFGPKGVLRNTNFGDLFKVQEQETSKFLHELNRELDASLRTRRDVSKAEIESIGKAVQIKENVLNKDLDLDISVKAFGSEILYNNLNIFQHPEKLTPEAIIRQIVDNFNKGLDKLKNFQEICRTNILFLDLELDYPTSLGFPLRLAVEGSSNTQLKTEGGVDVRSFVQNKDTNVNIKLVPSANIEVTGRLTLDALVVENGLKIISNLYTATGGDLKLTIKDGGKDVDVKFGLPVQIQKLLTANHEIVFESREQSGVASITPLKFAQAKDFSVCLDQLSDFIGLSFCAEINGPNVAGNKVPVLPFPLAGDAKIAVSVENEDVKEYHFKLVGKDHSHGQLLFETVGINGQKKLSVDIQGEISPQKYIKATFSSPVKSAFAEARITNNQQEKSLLLKAGQDQAEAYIKAGFGVSGSANQETYTPILEYKTPEGNQQLPVKVDGKIIVETHDKNKKYVFDNLKLHLPNQKTIGITGNVGNDGKEVFSDLTVSDGQQSGSLKGRVLVETNQLRINAEIKNTLNPSFNFKLQGEGKKTSDQTSLDGNWQLIHGQDLASKTNKITLVYALTNQYKNPNDYKFGFSNKFVYPLIGANVECKYENTPKTLSYDVDVQYNDIKFGSELDVEINKKTLGDFDIEYEIYGLENKVEFKSNREILEGEKSKIANELIINGAKLEVKGTITHSIRPSNVDVAADLNVILPTHPTPFKVDSGLQYNINEIDIYHKVVSGNVIICDAFIKANKNGNANGSINVNIKNLLEVAGQLKAVKGNGNAHIQINAITLKKQLRLESTFDVQPPTVYHITATLFPNYGEDKTQKIIVSTNTKLSPTNVDSKNSLNILGKALEVNLQGTRTGNDEQGKHNGEIEIILPNDQYLLGKVNGQFSRNDGTLNGQGQASVEYRKNKNTAGRKISISSIYKNVNPKESQYDITYNIAADDANGKNINADLIFKVHRENEKRVIDTSSKIYGSVLSQPLASSLQFSYTHGFGDYLVTSSYGTKFISKVGGKYDLRGENTPISGELDLELTLPSTNLKTVKSKLTGSVLIPKDQNGELQLQGSSSIFASKDSSSDPIVDFSAEGQVRASDKDGEIKGNIKSPKLDGPVSLIAGFSHKEDAGKVQCTGNLAVQYGKGKNIKYEGTFNAPNSNEYKLEASLETPFENYKKNVLNVHTKRTEDAHHVTSKVKYSNDGKEWNVDSEFKSSQISPLFDVKVKSPDNKKVELYLKGTRVSDKEFGIEYKALCEKSNFLLEGNIEANLADIEDFYFKGNIHSPRLDLNKISFEANNKGVKGSKKININVKSAGSNLVSGSTSYKSHEEHGKYIIEGSGSLKIKEESKPANFKYISQELTVEKNGEHGFEISFDAGIGDKAIDAEFKVTNKQFRISDSYCEKKRECAHFELDSKISENDVDKFKHVLEITVDLRKLGIPNEFGLKSVTKRNKFVLDHTVDIHFQSPENSKYQYSVYIHPEAAGASITTPKRNIALESHFKGLKDVQKVKQSGGKLSGEIAFYLDKKNQPNQKTSLSAWISANPKDKGVASAEVKLTHPGLLRPLLVSVHSTQSGEKPNIQSSIISTIDIFDKADQKIIIEYKVVPNVGYDQDTNDVKSTISVKSTGMKIDLQGSNEIKVNKQTYSGEYVGKLKYELGKSQYDNELVLKGGKTGSEFLLKLLNINILKLNSKYQTGKEDYGVDWEYSSYNNKPVVGHFEVKKFNTILYTVGYKANPKEKLQFNAGLVPGQIADIRCDHITASGKANLFHASVKLDDVNFFKPDYNVNTKAIESVISKCREEVKSFVTGFEKLANDVNNDINKDTTELSALASKIVPNLEPFKKYYSDELSKFKDEIIQDKSLQELGHLLKTIFLAVLDVSNTILVNVVNVIDATLKAVSQVASAILESIEKHIVPAFKELTQKIATIIGEIINTCLDIVSGYLALISNIIEKYQPEIKQLAATFGELGQDVARFISKSYEQIRKILSQLCDRIRQELDAIPIFSELKAQWEDFIANGLPNTEGFIGGLKEIAATIKDLVPPEVPVHEEIVEIIDITIDYLEKKLKQQSVDDLAVIDKLFNIHINLAKKIINLITASASDFDQPEFTISFDFLNKLPKLVAVKFSPISYLLNEDPSKDMAKFALSLLNDPRQWIPPFALYATTIQGQHIFTFDGKYVNFPANCKYLLVRDAVNGNFTVVGTFVNGALNAITVADQQDSITYNSNGQVSLNNAHTELPVRRPEIQAFRLYETFHIKSRAGVEIECTPSLTGCAVHVSGFYHAQLKGLFGRGNNEPYDDFTMANGKIVTSEAEFGNSYKIGNCQPVTVPPPAANNPVCDKLFGWESSLRYCYPFVDTDIYKQACAQGLAANIPKTDVAIASGYVGACLNHNIPISVPSNLVTCTNGDKTHLLGDKFTVKLPGTAADIVVLIDTVKSNEEVYKELIQPLTAELTKSLAAKGISDVEIHLITYNKASNWPNHVTIAGKLAFKGKAPELKFVEPEKKRPADLFHTIIHDLKLALGQDLQARTYTEGYLYPFRAHAVKSIIAVTSKPCEVGKLYPLQKLRTLLFKNNQISLHLFTPFDSFNVKDSNKAKDIIGFNDEHVFTVSQGKNKPEGTAELYKELQYNDYCVDFTVKNRGNVFVLNNFIEGKPDTKKQFLHVASHNIVKEMTNLEEELSCECAFNSPFTGKNVCREVYAKEKSSTKKASKS